MKRFMIHYALSVLLLSLLTNAAFAYTVYRITSTDGEKTVTYKVKFGGGEAYKQYTAFDPASKTFVYLSWMRNEQDPQPVCSIWDHQTGQTIVLYRFPNAKHPLPVIPYLHTMKVCPKTGDKNLKHEPIESD